MVYTQLAEQLSVLSNLLLTLNDQQYRNKINYLGKASIGGHARHVIELLKCATSGYDAGIVDYVNRERNMSIEDDRMAAIKEINMLLQKIIQPDKQMKMVAEAGECLSAIAVTTTFFREIIYNAEHTIHHLALIKVALREMNLDIVADDFGMAYSTVRYLSENKMKQLS